MSTNGEVPVGDTEMSECDGGEVVTMMDVLKEQQEFEDDANAVLGGSDDKECTYSQGYIKRQAIYACMTCCPESKEIPSERAGFCLACSLTCHENHDLVELYTKRNFRCDCGNPKFKSSCQFTPTKPDLNDENIYNQNFVGLYCICSKPYGEQENAFDDEMIQCVICEDWWHAAHLEAIVPAHDQFSEMVCKLCMAKNEFLHSYSALTVNVESGDVDVVNTNGVESTIPEEKHTYASETDENLSNGSMVVDKLTNGSIADDKLINGSIADETIVDNNKTDGELNIENQEKTMEISTTEALVTINDNEASSSEKESTVLNNAENDDPVSKNTVESDQEINNDMETSTTEAPFIGDEPVNNDNEASSSEKESTVLNNAENDTSASKNIVEADQEISNDMETSTTEASFIEDEPVNNDNDEASSSEKESTVSNNSDNNDPEPKKTGETDQEISSMDAIMDTTEDKVEEKTSEDVNEPPVYKTETGSTGDKLEETNAISTVESAEKTEETNEIPSEESEEKPTTETKPNESKNNDSSDQAIADAFKTVLPAESQEQEKEIVEDVDTTNSLINEVKKSPDEHSDNTDHRIPETRAPEGETSLAMQEDATSTVDSSKESERTNNIENGETVVPDTVSTEKRKLMEDDAEDSPAKKPKIDGKQCIRPKGVKKVHKGATFWPSDFRQKLCTCNECITMYKDLSVLFLTDMEDTVTAYETLGKERTAGKPNQYEKGIEALCSLGRIQQIDALTEYNKMRDKLLTFLQSFKEKKEVVTEHDIKTFFAGMKPEKRNDGVYFCG